MIVKKLSLALALLCTLPCLADKPKQSYVRKGFSRVFLAAVFASIPYLISHHAQFTFPITVRKQTYNFSFLGGTFQVDHKESNASDFSSTSLLRLGRLNHLLNIICYGCAFYYGATGMHKLLAGKEERSGFMSRLFSGSK